MKFLDCFPNCVFQTFKDKPEAEGYAKVFLEYNEPLFRDLNSRGCGIYFTPNGFKGGRKKENLVSLNAIFADLDVAKEGKGENIQEKKENLIKELRSWYEPNLIIETKNGIQPIFLLESVDISEKVQNKFTNVILGIIEWSKKHGAMGDQVKDVTRVLRLPCYNHMKGDPFMVKLRSYHGNKNTLDVLAEAFPFTEPKVETKPKPEYKEGLVSQAIDRIDFQDLTIKAFAYVGRRAEFDKQNRLILDGRLTGTFQGKNGDKNYLASTSHEPFKGNRVTVVADILGVTNKEAFKWIREQYGLDEEKLKARRAVKDIKPVIEKKTESYYTWGTDVLTKNFAPIKCNTSIVLVGETGDGKSTYAFDMAIKNAELGHKVLYISLEMTEGELHDNIARSYAGITVEEEVFGKIPEKKQESYKRRTEELKRIENLKTFGIVGTASLNWEGIVELMKGDWGLIFIDNLDLIEGMEKENDWDRQKRISKNILNYCNDHQVPIVLLHHYRKKNGMTARSVHDIGGSAKITHNAHRVIMLSRIRKKDGEETTEQEKATLNLLLDKARGYNRNFKTIYFYKGSFYDNYINKNDIMSDAYWQKI